ncbi:hypothetical protein [Labedaea rhizosphaerae]|uniref:hypothetical protein n=1 Tax=Labedaea rhizosphaerae TaxID=598644 RepID=UPI00105B3509|nr:hypothetical protein [Labedaea rhizosphaerae]
MAGAIVLLAFNAGRVARSAGIAGAAGTATVTECHQYGGPKHRKFECHGDFRGEDGLVRRGVVLEDTYEHEVGRSFPVRYDGDTAVSIEDIATAELAPMLCALAVPLLGLAAMLGVIAIGGRPDVVVKVYRYAGFVFLGGMALVIASLLVLMGSPMSPNL